MAWHLPRNNTDRKEKFRYFVEEVLDLPNRDDLIEELTAKFSQRTRQAIIDCPFVEGARDFLVYMQKRVAVYLISATPQFDLNEIIEESGLGKYFKKVFGAPINKFEILKNIMMVEKTSVDEILFIGDSPEDQQAAQNLAAHFIGVDSGRGLKSGGPFIMNEFQSILQIIVKNYEFVQG